MFREFDKNLEDKITYEEFVRGIAKWVKQPYDEKVKNLFIIYDLNENGKINLSEMLTMVYLC